MTAIAWAIFCGALITMHPRDRTSEHFAANNAVDVCLFLIGFGFLLYYSGKP